MAKTQRDQVKARIKRLRKGSRVIGLAAIQRTRAGAHRNRAERRIGNASNNWRSEWE